MIDSNVLLLHRAKHNTMKKNFQAQSYGEYEKPLMKISFFLP